MRGIMVQSLVSRGVPFETALQTATVIRDKVAGRGQVPIEELARLVEQELAGHDLEAVPLRPVEEPPLVRSAKSESGMPFSKGILAVSLQGAGLDPSDAWDVARELEARLLKTARREVDRDALRDLVRDTIERTHGARAAERYTVWRRAREDGRPVLILIGGSSGVGKTSVAVEVGRRLEIPRVIGTDSIRQIMRLMFSADLMPEIHGSTFDVYRSLRLTGGGLYEPVVQGYREQVSKISVGVQALIDRAVEENVSMVVEGANLLPGALDLARHRESAHIIFLVCAMFDEAVYRSRFAKRGDAVRERGADRYLDHYDEILKIQDHILSEADHWGLPIIDNVRFDDAVTSVIRSVIETLKKSMSPDPVSETA